MLSQNLLLGLVLAPAVIPTTTPEPEQEVSADLDRPTTALHGSAGAHAVFVPEPAVFDLVRGLGASAGELEVNSLFVMGLEAGELRWAPEVEWAFADGYAVELELPMVDRELDALKLAVQGTLPLDAPGVRHGWQVFGEVGMRDPDVDAVAVYLLAARWSPEWSALGMVGAKASIPSDADPYPRGVLNLSLFYDASRAVTLGLETNTLLGEGEGSLVRVVPQAHWQIVDRLRVQAGGGVEWTPSGLEPVAVVRAILE